MTAPQTHTTARDRSGAAFLATTVGSAWAKDVRKAAGLDQIEVGDMAGLSGSTITNIERHQATQVSSRVRVWRVLDDLAVANEVEYPDSLAKTNGTAPAVLTPDSGTLDVSVPGWAADLHHLHDAIGDQQLVSGPKVRAALASILASLGGES